MLPCLPSCLNPRYGMLPQTLHDCCCVDEHGHALAGGWHAVTTGPDVRPQPGQPPSDSLLLWRCQARPCAGGQAGGMLWPALSCVHSQIWRVATDLILLLRSQAWPCTSRQAGGLQPPLPLITVAAMAVSIRFTAALALPSTAMRWRAGGQHAVACCPALIPRYAVSPQTSILRSQAWPCTGRQAGGLQLPLVQIVSLGILPQLS